ncbi:MAG: bifunctional UDP-sugar hydrolase/5'-nucleotidase [Ruthenibacterium sp.]
MKYQAKIRIGMLVLVACVLFSACAAPQTSSSASVPEAQAKDVVILYTNDAHCEISDAIGYAGLSACKKEMSQSADVLLVDAGDAAKGQVLGMVSNGEAPIELMNEVGYDVAIPGNHEFDYGIESFLALTKKAKFPYISANFTDLRTDKLVLEPYKMFTAGGKKIAFVGVTTPLTIIPSIQAYFQDENGKPIYGFDQDETGEKLYTAVQTAVDSARAEGADYVFALTHLGTLVDAAPYTSSEMIAHTKGIDAVLDGHSHSVIPCNRVKNADGAWTLLSSTGAHFNAIGMLLLTKDGNISTGLTTDYRVMAASSVNLIVNDPTTGERIVCTAETNLGDLCTDAYRHIADADVALLNGGNLHADLEAGDLTYSDLMAMQAYSNSLCEVEATGQQILDALEMGVRALPEESGGFLQVSGLTYEIDAALPSSVKTDEMGIFVSVDGDYRVKNVKIGDEALDTAKTYTVVSNDFLIKGGAGVGCNLFAKCPLVKDAFILENQALVQYITEKLGGTVGDAYANPYGDGRIVEYK